VRSYFNTLLKEVKEKGNPKRFSHHKITIEDAVAQGLWLKIKSLLPDDDEQKNWTDDEFLQSCRDEMPDEASYLQEYMCVPEDDADSFLSWEMIMACSNAVKVERWRREPGPYFVGFDVGRKRDLSVISVFRQVGTQMIEVEEIIMTKTPFREQRRRLWEILNMPTVSRCCIDATGLGMQIAEETVEEYGEFRVQPVMFTAAVKQELAYPMRAMFEDRSISIFDDRLSHADLRSVKTETTKSGAVIFTVEAGSTDGHADRFWSKALAIHAAKTLTDPGIFARLKQFMRGGTGSESRRSLRSKRNME
jgi:phage FluMu gp28-like protein